MDTNGYTEGDKYVKAYTHVQEHIHACLRRYHNVRIYIHIYQWPSARPLQVECDSHGAAIVPHQATDIYT